MTVFSDFRRCANALERLAAGQKSAASWADTHDHLLERLRELELDRSQFESDCEGLLMKAEGKLKAAANAEARERTMRNSRDEDLFAGSDPDSPEVEAGVPRVDVEAGQEEEMLDVPVALAFNSKEHATRMKFL